MEQIKSFRKDEAKRNWRKLKIKILTVVRFGGYLRHAVEDSSTDTDNQKKERTNIKRRSSIARLSEASVRLRNNTKETLNEAKEAAKKGASTDLVSQHVGGSDAASAMVAQPMQLKPKVSYQPLDHTEVLGDLSRGRAMSCCFTPFRSRASFQGQWSIPRPDLGKSCGSLTF